uniref:G-protein coupled receptors family 1 profile domain-containing protein n=1 Tax=Salmo trutta TaxID=8032 RepID=A0A673XC44_SALTR
MTDVNDTTAFPCGLDPPYYTNMIGIVVDWIIFLIGFPAVCLASYALFSLVKAGRVAPVYVINLLISDLLQITITLVFIFSRIFVRLGLCTSLGFMLLISLERYMVVVCPLWYRRRRSVKNSTLVSLSLWALALVYVTFDYNFLIDMRYTLMTFSAISLLPAPFLVLLFLVTQRALSRSMAFRGAERRRRILGALGLVLGSYTLLFLPYSIRNLYYSIKAHAPSVSDPVRDLSSVITSALLYLSPLTDCFLYIFMRRDLRDTVDAFPCCRRLLSVGDAELTGNTAQENSGIVN